MLRRIINIIIIIIIIIITLLDSVRYIVVGCQLLSQTDRSRLVEDDADEYQLQYD